MKNKSCCNMRAYRPKQIVVYQIMSLIKSSFSVLIKKYLLFQVLLFRKASNAPPTRTTCPTCSWPTSSSTIVTEKTSSGSIPGSKMFIYLIVGFI